MKIEENKAVSFHYTLKNDSGEVIDESKDQPLFYLHGHQNIIPGLEAELLGKAVGDKLDVSIEPKDGYGESIAELVQKVPRSQFEQSDTLQIGMQFQVDTPQGPMVFQITELGDEEVTVDGNHPLAGQNLHFSVEVVEIREASEDELSQGHIQG